jgi:hypothetical protein
VTALLPRLDREQTQAQIELARNLTVSDIAARMPVRDLVTTASALGGLEISDADLLALRAAVVDLANDHGYPSEGDRLSVFDGRCAGLLHEALPVSPHEAAEEAVWSHLTVCWLMDVAVWRWTGMRDDRRFRGDINRNTFRRLWWRAEILGPDVDLTRLGEDELVNVMERPTIACNRRLARTLATSFLERVGDGDDGGRMMLMREAGKRLVRLTPIVDFHALDDAELRDAVQTVLDAAANGGPLPQPALREDDSPTISDGVEQVPSSPPLPAPEEELAANGQVPVEVAELYEIALGIARRTGRVTNVTLREVVAIEADDARRILQDLVARGELRRRGQTKGTYYVLSAEDAAGAETPAPAPGAPPPRPSVPGALRRYLRRGR